MNSDHDVRELLERMAREPAIGPVEPEPIVRRAHRRLARTVVLGYASVALLAGVAIGGANLVLSSPTVPATPNETDEVPNGDLAFVGDGNLHVVDPSTGQTRILVRACSAIDQGCAWIESADWSPDGTRIAYAMETEAAEGGAAGI